MRFTWKDYSPDMIFAESWVDGQATRMAGLDDGWRSFNEYWTTDGALTVGKDYWCKVVYDKEEPFAAVALSYNEGMCFVMELLVKPEFRGKGYGTSLIRELIENGEEIIQKRITSAHAVIFPNNIASQRAFEKAGFVFDHENDDHDVLYYRYEKAHVKRERGGKEKV